MRHTPAQLIAAIDRHAPRDWRRSNFPEPRMLVLPELESFALSSIAFAQGHLWNEAWTDPAVGFPIMRARGAVLAYLAANPDTSQGVIHFGHGFIYEIVRMIQIQSIPSHLTDIVKTISQGTDDVFQDVELFWVDGSVRLRFVTT